MEITSLKPKSLTFDSVVEYNRNFRNQILLDKSGMICLDLSAVTHCDSAGLALLLETKKLCKQHQKKLEIREMPKETQSLAEFCGIESLLYES